jgi:hypothetical protein
MHQDAHKMTPKSMPIDVMLSRVFIIMILIFAWHFWMYGLVNNNFVVRLISCCGAAFLLFCAVSSFLVPVCIGGNKLIRRFPSLQRHLGSIWFSGGLISVSMFCVGVYYALVH